MHTVDIPIMHMLLMHNRHNAWAFDGSHVGVQAKAIFFAYCIMHGQTMANMHYEGGLKRLWPPIGVLTASTTLCPWPLKLLVACLTLLYIFK
jgi:hypothetical protein